MQFCREKCVTADAGLNVGSAAAEVPAEITAMIDAEGRKRFVIALVLAWALLVTPASLLGQTPARTSADANNQTVSAIAGITVPESKLRWGLRVWRNVELKVEERRCLGTEEAAKAYAVPLDVYRPNDAKRRPWVMMIHGGAWSMGTKNNLQTHAIAFAKAGFVVLSPDYRLAPEHLFPAQLVDCRALLSWCLMPTKETPTGGAKKPVQSATDLFGIEREKYGLWGYSAGAQLAALLAIEASRDAPAPAACIVGGIPADFDWVEPDSDILAHVFGGPPKTFPDVYLAASPRKQLHAKVCPLLIYHGTADFLVPPAVGRRFHQTAIDVGIDSTFVSLVNKEHMLTFLNAGMRDRSIRFLTNKLPPEQAAR
ncbi:MAG TPA: hypothetical protein DDW52_12025 [Planctomycetaceae bacterium]|nr:hypothetical protein [Planctomycetaceae bacterium]